MRIAWPDVGPPTPFRISSAGPGGAVLLSLLYDTLVWKDENGIIPWLASAWDVSPDGRLVTFTLRKDVSWQDGQPLTARDVAFSFACYAQHPYQWMSTFVVQSATSPDDGTVKIQLSQPYAPFLDEIAGVVPIIPEHVWSAVDDPARYTGANASVGSGPYQLATYQSAQGAYRLTANPHYFAGDVLVEEVQQIDVPDAPPPYRPSSRHRWSW